VTGRDIVERSNRAGAGAGWALVWRTEWLQRLDGDGERCPWREAHELKIGPGTCRFGQTERTDSRLVGHAHCRGHCH
jgi:hypothetical protein